MIERMEKNGAPIFTSLNGGTRAFNPYINPDYLIFELIPDGPDPDYAEPIDNFEDKKGVK